MNYSELFKLSESFYKQAQDSNEESIKKVFDSWEDALDPSISTNQNKIQQVICQNKIFEKRNYGDLVPVCLVESSEAKPPSNWLMYAPAFLLRFGNFPEQPYKDSATQIEYCKKILTAHTNFNDKQFIITPSQSSQVRNKIKNSNYNQYIVVFHR